VVVEVLPEKARVVRIALVALGAVVRTAEHCVVGKRDGSPFDFEVGKGG